MLGSARDLLGSRLRFSARDWQTVARATTRSRLPFLEPWRPNRLELGLLGVLMVFALPFVLTSAGGEPVGLGGVAAPQTWDAIGRAGAAGHGGWLPRLSDGPPDSPLWTLLLTVLAIPLRWAPEESLPATARILGLLFFWIGLTRLLRFCRDVASGHLAIGVCMVVTAFDPWNALGRAGGSEANLLFSFSALTVVSLVRGDDRFLRAGALGLALVQPHQWLPILGLVILHLGRGIPSRLSGQHPGAHVWRTASVFAPAGVAVLLVALWAQAAHVGPAGGSPIPEIDALVRSLAWLDKMGGIPFGGAVVGTLLIATVVLINRVGLSALALPWMVVSSFLWIATSLGRAGAWGAESLWEAHGSLLVPYLALALGLALSALAIASRSSLLTRVPRYLAPVAFGFVVGGLWAMGGLVIWPALTSGYAQGSRDVRETSQAAARWVNANVPAGSRIALGRGAEPAGVVLTAAPHLTLSTSVDAVERAFAGREISYAIVLRQDPLSGSPRLREVASTYGERYDGTLRTGASVFHFRDSAALPDSSAPTQIQVGPYAIVDHLDVADASSEVAHFYQSATQGESREHVIAMRDGWIVEKGRSQEAGRGEESFVLRTTAGKDALLGLRYLNDGGARLRVDIDGTVHVMDLQPCPIVVCEDVVLVPGGAIKRASTRFVVTSEALGPSRGSVTTLRYWLFERA